MKSKLLKIRRWLDESYYTNNGDVAYMSAFWCVVGFLLCMLVLILGGFRL